MDVVLTEAAHVREKVVDEAGNPVSGAKVTVGDSTTTDAQGNYFIKRVSTKNRTLSAESTGENGRTMKGPSSFMPLMSS